MNLIKKTYYYFFYKLYKFWGWISYPKFWSYWKAGVSIVVLELWGMLMIINYYYIFNNGSSKDVTKSMIIIPSLIIIILNYIAFDHYYNIWKNYKEEFDQLPNRKNIIGGIIVWVIILFIVINFFISTFHLHKMTFGKY